MGATRRLNNYDPALGWQGLFIVAAIGAAIIFLGLGFQILQLIVSIRQRHSNIAGADPWNGRTLEWATSSLPPFYNFADIPVVVQRDDFWHSKKHHRPDDSSFEAFYLPRNSYIGLFIGGFALAGGFAVVWHIWWLAVVGLLGIITAIIIRISNDDTEYRVTARQLEQSEAERGQA